MTFAKFIQTDFPEYKSWYNDTELNMRLGPMDDDWLEHVMNAKDSYQHSVLLNLTFVTKVSAALYSKNFSDNTHYHGKHLWMQITLKQNHFLKRMDGSAPINRIKIICIF